LSRVPNIEGPTRYPSIGRIMATRKLEELDLWDSLAIGVLDVKQREPSKDGRYCCYVLLFVVCCLLFVVCCNVRNKHCFVRGASFRGQWLRGSRERTMTGLAERLVWLWSEIGGVAIV